MSGWIVFKHCFTVMTTSRCYVSCGCFSGTSDDETTLVSSSTPTELSVCSGMTDFATPTELSFVGGANFDSAHFPADSNPRHPLSGQEYARLASGLGGGVTDDPRVTAADDLVSDAVSVSSLSVVSSEGGHYRQPRQSPRMTTQLPWQRPRSAPALLSQIVNHDTHRLMFTSLFLSDCIPGVVFC